MNFFNVLWSGTHKTNIETSILRQFYSNSFIEQPKNSTHRHKQTSFTLFFFSKQKISKPVDTVQHVLVGEDDHLDDPEPNHRFFADFDDPLDPEGAVRRNWSLHQDFHQLLPNRIGPGHVLAGHASWADGRRGRYRQPCEADELLAGLLLGRSPTSNAL